MTKSTVVYVLTDAALSRQLAKRKRYNYENRTMKSMGGQASREQEEDGLRCHKCRFMLNVGDKIVSKIAAGKSKSRRKHYHFACAELLYLI